MCKPRFEEESDSPKLERAVLIIKNPLHKCCDEWCNMRLCWLCNIIVTIVGICFSIWLLATAQSHESKWQMGGIVLLVLSCILLLISLACFWTTKIKRKKGIYVPFRVFLGKQTLEEWRTLQSTG